MEFLAILSREVVVRIVLSGWRIYWRELNSQEINTEERLWQWFKEM